MALFGHGAISELSLLSGAKRKLDFEPAKGSFWRKVAIQRTAKSRMRAQRRSLDSDQQARASMTLKRPAERTDV
jgi:hypothetical protein